MIKKEVDIWAGVGGFSLKVKGFLIGDDVIEITDLKWLDNMGWNPEIDGPYIYECCHLSDSYYVSYDDYCWSELGFVPNDKLIYREDEDIFELWPTI